MGSSTRTVAPSRSTSFHSMKVSKLMCLKRQTSSFSSGDSLSLLTSDKASTKVVHQAIVGAPGSNPKNSKPNPDFSPQNHRNSYDLAVGTSSMLRPIQANCMISVSSPNLSPCHVYVKCTSQDHEQPLSGVAAARSTPCFKISKG